ncbi:MAG: hypothetical protein ACYDC0_16270 [Acidimicrobiales bacterium]
MSPLGTQTWEISQVSLSGIANAPTQLTFLSVDGHLIATSNVGSCDTAAGKPYIALTPGSHMTIACQGGLAPDTQFTAVVFYEPNYGGVRQTTTTREISIS